MLIIILLFFISFIGTAQEDECPNIVEKALTATKSVCSEIDRNHACLGHTSVSVTPFTGHDIPSLEQAGDRTDINGIASFTLSPMNVEEGQWGILLMQVQANIPTSLPGQNVTILLFGDVEVENMAEVVNASPTLTVSVNGNMNVRGGPSTNDVIVGSLSGSDRVVANGRNAGG